MEPTRRGFLKSLGILLGAGAAQPVAQILIPEPRRKIWAVGATLDIAVVAPRPRRLVFPVFEIVSTPEISLVELLQQRLAAEILATEILAAKDLAALKRLADARAFTMPLRRTQVTYTQIGRQSFRVEPLLTEYPCTLAIPAKRPA